ncbi:MAG: hypothetical protein KAW46_11095 [candidate division Zixibacteria bacterium]|nr:hypothetical protein [candidate division Zixibacteria bacterium]
MIENFLTPENIKFSKALENFMTKWGYVEQFRHLAAVSIPEAHEYYSRYLRGVFETMKPGGELGTVLIDPEEFFRNGNPEQVAVHTAKRCIDNALNVVDTASLIFGHSLLDGLINQYIEIIESIDQDVFVDRIKDAKVKLSSILEGDVQQIIQNRVAAHVKGLQRESVIKRCDFLHEICQPTDDAKRMGEYKFDRDRLRKLDDARHNIIHEPNILGKTETLRDDLDYLTRTGMYFLKIMHYKYDLKIISGVDRFTGSN